ncbi:MAG TPA: TonB-dependent receptor plug domain-containing protein [Gammaproteobacteria bacterium]|nr:TonB-dependent receptor plug domain-containing protein [Gammaproteobacteria bacterium]
MTVGRNPRRAVLAAVAATVLCSTAAAADGGADLLDLSIEQLAELKVTSVSKSPEKLSETASAIQVVTADEIERSGAMDLPEALRLASNLQVARANSHDWAITARGFDGALLGNGSAADKMLVLIDGRSVYTPLFAGVFWDVQNVDLADIDHIEVVSGPGGTLWGSNAVNGVINVVTRPAADTQGLRVSGAYGNFLENAASLRYGGSVGDAHFRVYGQRLERGQTKVFGTDARDAWRIGQGGFRLDLAPSDDDVVTLQGDAYDGTEGTTSTSDVAGHNVLGRWTRTLSPGASWTLQAYFDHTDRRLAPSGFRDRVDAFDVDFEERLAPARRLSLVWGAGYRSLEDDTQGSASLSFDPASRVMALASAFLQSDFALIPERLRLTAGSKVEHNDFTGLEVQPRVQVSWTPTGARTVWAAVTRAVRSPSRIDVDEITPSLETLEDFESESVVAYELGYRGRPTSAVAYSVSAFFNRYDDLRSIDLNLSSPPALTLANNQAATTWGIELAGDVQLGARWRLRGGYSYLHERIEARSPLVVPGSAEFEALDPRQQLVLHSMLDVLGNLKVDATVRYVDALPDIAQIPSHFDLDLRVAWTADRWEAALVGRNLLRPSHLEFSAAAIPRNVLGTFTWRL